MVALVRLLGQLAQRPVAGTLEPLAVVDRRQVLLLLLGDMPLVESITHDASPWRAQSSGSLDPGFPKRSSFDWRHHHDFAVPWALAWGRRHDSGGCGPEGRAWRGQPRRSLGGRATRLGRASPAAQGSPTAAAAPPLPLRRRPTVRAPPCWPDSAAAFLGARASLHVLFAR